MTKQAINEILAKWRNGQASAQEEQMIEAWYESLVASGEIELSEAQKADWKTLILQRIEASIDQEEVIAIAPVHRVHFLKRIRWVAAAVVILVAGVAGYFMLTEKVQPEVIVSVKDIKAPETNRATITLANGKTVYLDSAGNGQLENMGGIVLSKLGDGSIVYAGDDVADLGTNTLSNPIGSRAISMQLSDGTKLWLNAGSSVTYPVAFAANRERRVRMTGEAFFEVTHTGAGFTVEHDQLAVKVLGTEFNVKAYGEEAAPKVTLVKGAVRLESADQTLLLKPGQQAVVKSDKIELVREDDVVTEATAWMRNRTIINSADLPEILGEIRRWYNISTEIKGNPAKRSIYFNVSREGSLADVLDVLKKNNVKYEYDATIRKLTVLP